MLPFHQAAPLFDKLVFSKVKQRLGGNVKLIVSGGAPLAPHVEEFLKVAMCSPVVQVSVFNSVANSTAGGVECSDCCLSIEAAVHCGMAAWPGHGAS